MLETTIRKYKNSDEAAVIALWERSKLIVPWNDPKQDIAMKMAWQPELFLVAEQSGEVVGTAIVGYDGHRGTIFYLASDRLGGGKKLMEEAEKILKGLGCPKINLQVRETNKGVIKFYKKLGYNIEPILNLGKRL